MQVRLFSPTLVKLCFASDIRSLSPKYLKTRPCCSATSSFNLDAMISLSKSPASKLLYSSIVLSLRLFKSFSSAFLLSVKMSLASLFRFSRYCFASLLLLSAGFSPSNSSSDSNASSSSETSSCSSSFEDGSVISSSTVGFDGLTSPLDLFLFFCWVTSDIFSRFSIILKC
ncbi:EC1118_1P2_4698p [Saccharomyces cerevisiae EC1118]|uniref:Putative uncharacterized protein YPR136C n=3 Tax=Saccharomyces cerevisiae TaxID=4932 RepID=YPR36_YEAST|nr:RecName: Full=Putative uncharacterized protein YPR136C [Saccharomyces cerevisiae S288C]AAB68292.1 Ypr136cp [Saccharomyces cerevisiae]EDZ68669.1 hypothetical protein AWRI1631_163870 [Saccharomyces cerevisiae AWRI1631]CAY87090.1 EC1118_1P2_4698p [Saccharomyces cerevisiae EC1118]